MINYEEVLGQLTCKIRKNIEKIGDDLREFPGRVDGEYFQVDREKCIALEHIFGWTQSFFTGMAYWSYEFTGDMKFIEWMNGLYQQYYNKVFKTPLETMHDLGFIYTPYAVSLYKLTNDQNMKKIGIKAADELAKRFVPQGGYIRAWGRMDDKIPDYVDKELATNHFFTESKGLAIIDCMMNLPLLFWASEVTGHPYYRNIAKIHANTTKKYFIRSDRSVYHAYRFDEETGEPLGGANYCGYSIESHWARGTAWAVYGFIIAYQYTKERDYLEVAIALAEEFNKQGQGKLPMWDFRLPDTYNQEEVKHIDTSAAVILCCAIYEIVKVKAHEELKQLADNYMKEVTQNYINLNKDLPGILKNQNGNDGYSCFGDYFYVEALMKIVKNCTLIW